MRLTMDRCRWRPGPPTREASEDPGAASPACRNLRAGVLGHGGDRCPRARPRQGCSGEQPPWPHAARLGANQTSLSHWQAEPHHPTEAERAIRVPHWTPPRGLSEGWAGVWPKWADPWGPSISSRSCPYTHTPSVRPSGPCRGQSPTGPFVPLLPPAQFHSIKSAGLRPLWPGLPGVTGVQFGAGFLQPGTRNPKQLSSQLLTSLVATLTFPG